MSLGWPWAGSGSRKEEDAPFYPAPGHCKCCIAGWWHSDMGVMGPTTCSIILHPASFIGRLSGAGPKALPLPKRPRVLSLSLVTMHWAQLLDVPWTFSASQLTRTNLVLLLLSQAMAESNPTAQRPPLSSVSLCARANVYEVPQ